MDKARISVDFNEMVDDNIVMLSKTDNRTDSRGKIVTLYDGMPIEIYEENIYEDGEVEYLIADGIVIKHDLDAYPFSPHVKWFCLIDSNGIQDKPELRDERGVSSL